MREYDVLETLVTKFEPYIANMDEVSTGKNQLHKPGMKNSF